MAGSDGTPTDLYKSFRNEATRGRAAAAVLRHGYAPLYTRNEYVHTLSEKKLEGLIIEETGVDAKNSGLKYTVKCIQGINAFASHDVVPEETSEPQPVTVKSNLPASEDIQSAQKFPGHGHGVGMNLSYTINLNLPATSDIAVFNAIFKSLNENLLRDQDG